MGDAHIQQTTAAAMSTELASTSAPVAAGPTTLSAEASTNRIRPWKAPRTGGSTARVQKTKQLSRSWEQRTSERKKEEAVKKLEREMIDEKKADIERRKTIAKERKEALEERRRLEEAAAKMSAKKLQRLKKRLNRTKKVSG